MIATLEDNFAAQRLADLGELLNRYRYLFASEAQLQARIAEVLNQESVAATREYSLGAYRFDFFVEERFVIEVKIKGSLADALRQVDQYLALPQVDGVLLASTCMWRAESPMQVIRGKPLVLAYLSRAAF